MNCGNTKWQNIMQLYNDNKIQNETTSAMAEIDDGPHGASTLSWS